MKFLLSEIVATGDCVYYKHSDSNRWKGPGKVLGQDGQQVLMKNGDVCEGSSLLCSYKQKL